MPNYKNKTCELCKIEYTPTSPKQKFCDGCKSVGKRLRDRINDRDHSRKDFGYVEYTRNCLACGKEFTTHYKKKVYCGEADCEKVRLYRKTHFRTKDEDCIRKKEYYYRTREQRLLQKAVEYRKHNLDAKEYVPGRVFKHDIDFVNNYFEKFGYSIISTEYVNNRDKLLVKCPIGHEWGTSFHNFKDLGNRCLHCYVENNYTSKPEQKLLDYFTTNYPTTNIVHNDRTQINPYELDLYFPDNKLAVEVCGLYWHSEISGGKSKKYHYDKMMRCFEKGIRLITVFEDEIRDKFEIVLSRILTALNLATTRVYARKCDLLEIDSKTANRFFEENHIQGRSTSIKVWGLYYESKLVSVCSIGMIGRKHAGGEGVIELKRFCSKNGVSVVGGFSKLFKVVIEYCSQNGYKFIKSYCDMRYANIHKPVYEQVGFILRGGTKYTPHYFRKGIRYRNVSLRKTPEERLTGLTEWELRKSQGYDRIWDCGHRTYVYGVF
jgi:very-short-patch-repair endonuclease